MDYNDGVVEEAKISKRKSLKIKDIIQAMNAGLDENEINNKQNILKSLKAVRKYITNLEIF